MLVSRHHFSSAAGYLGAYLQRQEEIMRAIHDPSDRADAKEHIEDVRRARDVLLQISVCSLAPVLMVQGVTQESALKPAAMESVGEIIAGESSYGFAPR